MRKTLKKKQTLQLRSAGDNAAEKELVIVSVIGMGANVIAYEATEKTGQIHYVLKECCPEIGAERGCFSMRMRNSTCTTLTTAVSESEREAAGEKAPAVQQALLTQK